MKPKATKQEIIKKKKAEAIALWGIGLTTREIGKKVGRSHAWVANLIKGLDKDLTGSIIGNGGEDLTKAGNIKIKK